MLATHSIESGRHWQRYHNLSVVLRHSLWPTLNYIHKALEHKWKKKPRKNAGAKNKRMLLHNEFQPIMLNIWFQPLN